LQNNSISSKAEYACPLKNVLSSFKALWISGIISSLLTVPCILAI